MGKKEEVEDTTATGDDTTTTTGDDTTKGTDTQTPVLPTNKEELDALMAVAEQKGKDEAQDEYKGIQRTVNKKNDEIERLNRKLAQPPETSADFGLEEAMIASKRGELGESDPLIAQMEQALATRKQAVRQRTQLQYQEGEIQKHQTKFNKLIEDAGLDLGDERLEDFHDAFEDATEDGRFGKAERKLNRILSKVEPKGKKKESEEDTKAKWIEEGKRLGMEEKGMLKTDNNQPSGAGSSDEEFVKKYGSGELPMTPENYKRAQGILDKLQRGG